MNSDYTSDRVSSTKRICLIALFLFFVTAVLLTGCETMDTVTQIGAAVGVATAQLTGPRRNPFKKAPSGCPQFQDFTRNRNIISAERSVRYRQ